MSILDIYRYLRGYISIRVEGGFPERFINLCNRENVYLWDSFYSGGILTAKLYCKDFRKLLSIRRKSGVKIKAVQKYGLFFFIRRNRKRKILAAGLITALVSMLIMNSFVWSIDIIGSQSIEKNEIRETLKAYGLKYGTYVPAFDAGKAGRDAVNSSDGKILWLAINIKGSKATVEVRDYIKPDKQTADKTPCNIVADFDGIILSAYTHRGVQVADSGTAVKKGDMIISGIAENENGTEYLHAEGEVAAIHEVKHEIRFSDSVNVSTPTALKNGYSLKLFGISIPLYIKSAEASDFISYSRFLTFDGNVIPIGTEKITVINNRLNSQRQCDLLEKIDEFSRQEYVNFKNTVINDVRYEFNRQKTELSIKGYYTCIDFIGKEAEIIKEN